MISRADVSEARAKYSSSEEGKLRQQYYKLRNWQNVLISSAKISAGRRGLGPIEIGAEWVSSQFDKQQGRCYHTGILMVPTAASRSLFQPSLERLNNGLGYSPHNTVLVSWAANSARGSSSLAEFHSWLAAIKNPDEIDFPAAHAKFNEQDMLDTLEHFKFFDNE